MTEAGTKRPVLELRVALTATNFARSLKFYCDGLGLEAAQEWNNEQGRAAILEMGDATLEIFNEQQRNTVDQIEAGRSVTGQIRFALQVPDVQAATDRLLAHGATLVHAPVVTPWGDINSRLQDPDGMQITLFQKAKGGAQVG